MCFYASFQIAIAQTLGNKADFIFVSAYEAHLFADTSTLSRPDKIFALWLASDPLMTAEKQATLSDEFNSFCQELQAKRTKFKSEIYFLWYVFNKVHADFLDFYGKNPPFYHIFSKKHHYNCVSGTALYDLVFQNLGYQTLIKETQDHVYLIVNTGKIQILIESTDSIHGFITGKRLIEKQEKEYIGKSVTREITLVNLCGLQYFNQAVDSYYRKDYSQSQLVLDKAKLLYPDSGKIWRLTRKIRDMQLAENTIIEKKTVKIVASKVHEEE